MKTRSSIALGLIVVAATFAVPGFANALELSATLVIQNGETEILNRVVPVADTCTVTDIAGGTHTLAGYVGGCALQAAKDAGYITDFETKSFSFGLWLDSINGITTTPDFSQGWAVWKNSALANVGVHGLMLSGGDTLLLTYGPWPSALLENEVSGPVVADVYPRQLDAEQAVSFLVANQEKDGSFGHPLFSDWAAVALGAYEGKSATALAAKEALKTWLRVNPVGEGSVLTDYERRAMAVMSLGIDPYQGTGQNVVEAILNGFDGQQFGNPGLVNDDIFAVLVLLKAGYEANVTPLLETLPFILSWQRESGSFGSIDLTAAAVQALSLLPESNERDKALLKAREYLAVQQESSGGFGNAYSTSWVLQAIAALNEDGDEWAMSLDRRTPEHFLALHQAQDGGLLGEESLPNRIWATSYAIPAALSKSWGDILWSFAKPAGLAPAPKGEGELSEEEVAAFGTRIEMLESEIAEVQSQILARQHLESIQSEVSRIAEAVEALRPQVAAVYSSYLAQQGEPARELAVAPELESSSVAPGVQDVSEQFTAEAAGTAGQDFFSSGSGQLVLALGAAVILFLFFGGWKATAPFLLRRPSV